MQLDPYLGLVEERPHIQLVIDKNTIYEVSAEKYQQLKTASDSCYNHLGALEYAVQVIFYTPSMQFITF